MNETTITARMHKDGTVVEVLPDGSERSFPKQPMRPMTYVVYNKIIIVGSPYEQGTRGAFQSQPFRTAVTGARPMGQP